MSTASVAPSPNQLIASLPSPDRLRLIALCEPVQLALAQVLGQPGKPARYAYFPTGCFISLVAKVQGHPGVEVAMVGDEGMLGTQLALGVATSPLQALVQGAGPALRVGAAALRREVARSPALQRTLLQYSGVLLAQVAASAVCLHYHTLAPRLARWLLMSQDRSQSKSFKVTQAFLAHMLGVRRAGVSIAASSLQERGLIEYSRGALTVLDRAGLEDAACECYAADRKLLKRS